MGIFENPSIPNCKDHYFQWEYPCRWPIIYCKSPLLTLSVFCGFRAMDWLVAPTLLRILWSWVTKQRVRSSCQLQNSKGKGLVKKERSLYRKAIPPEWSDQISLYQLWGWPPIFSKDLPHKLVYLILPNQVTTTIIIFLLE